MPEYEGNQLIELSPDDAFAFISDIRTLPMYLPTVQSAEPMPGGRVRIRGRQGNAEYVDDGFLEIDRNRRRMEWRADELNYRGRLEVGDENGMARISVRLVFGVGKIPGAEQTVADESARETQPVFGRGENNPISRSLDAALSALHDLTTGRGGQRVVPPAAIEGQPPAAEGTG